MYYTLCREEFFFFFWLIETWFSKNDWFHGDHHLTYKLEFDVLYQGKCRSIHKSTLSSRIVPDVHGLQGACFCKKKCSLWAPKQCAKMLGIPFRKQETIGIWMKRSGKKILAQMIVLHYSQTITNMWNVTQMVNMWVNYDQLKA